MAIIKDSFGKEIQYIYGGLNPDGSKWCGEGFHSSKSWGGTYTIAFNRRFLREPALMCTIYGDEQQTFNMSISVVEVFPFHFVCITSSPDIPRDCGFTFIASGEV